MIERSTESFCVKLGWLRNSQKCAFLLVEGKTDVDLFETFKDRLACRLQPVGGKDRVIDAMKKLEEKKFPGVLALVDADFDALEEKANYGNNVLLTDCHDAEGMIIKSEALDRFLLTFGDATKIAELLGNSEDSEYSPLLRNRLLSICRETGYLRWFNERAGLWFKFDDVDLSRYVDDSFSKIYLDKLVKDLVQNHISCKLGPEDVIEGARKLISLEHDLWMVCRGHDLTRILLVGLRKFGKGENWELGRLEYLLRTNYHWNNFVKSILFSLMKSWEKRNPSFRVFKRELSHA